MPIRRSPPGGQVDHPGPRLATAAVVPVVPIIDGGKLVPTCRVVPAVPIIDLAAVLPYAGKLVPVVPCPSSRATPWQAGADHRPCQRRSLRRSAGSHRRREGRARQYESIILRNWPECGHRRRLNCSTFTAGGGAGAWVLPPSSHLLTATAWVDGSQLRAQIRQAGPPRWAGRSSGATARNGRGGARGADHRRREAGADVPSRAGRADHRPCRGPALRREAGARGAMPIIQGHALASWCRSSTLPEAVPSS